jgi:hypothetical protein
VAAQWRIACTGITRLESTVDPFLTRIKAVFRRQFSLLNLFPEAVQFASLDRLWVVVRCICSKGPIPLDLPCICAMPAWQRRMHQRREWSKLRALPSPPFVDLQLV